MRQQDREDGTLTLCSERRTDYSVRFTSVASNYKTFLGISEEAWHTGSPGCAVGLY